MVESRGGLTGWVLYCLHSVSSMIGQASLNLTQHPLFASHLYWGEHGKSRRWWLGSLPRIECTTCRAWGPLLQTTKNETNLIQKASWCLHDAALVSEDIHPKRPKLSQVTLHKAGVGDTTGGGVQWQQKQSIVPGQQKVPYRNVIIEEKCHGDISRGVEGKKSLRELSLHRTLWGHDPLLDIHGPENQSVWLQWW